MAQSHHHGAHAPGLAAPQRAPITAGLTAPLKNEAPGWQAEGDEGNTEPNSRDSAHHAPGAQPADAVAAAEKSFSTLQARLALRGFALTRTEDAGGLVVYTVTRWGLVRELSSLVEVATFAGRVGAPA